MDVSVNPRVRKAGALSDMASTSARKLRLLCLHGFRTSGKIMKQQMEKAKWIEAMGDLVELVSHLPFFLNEFFLPLSASCWRRLALFESVFKINFCTINHFDEV